MTRVCAGRLAEGFAAADYTPKSPLALALNPRHRQITGRPGSVLESSDSTRITGPRPTSNAPAAADAARGAEGAAGALVPGLGDAEARAGGDGVGVVAEAPPPVPLKQLKPLSLCSSSADLVVGQKVFAIGNPFGESRRRTRGASLGRPSDAAALQVDGMHACAPTHV